MNVKWKLFDETCITRTAALGIYTDGVCNPDDSGMWDVRRVSVKGKDYDVYCKLIYGGKGVAAEIVDLSEGVTCSVYMEVVVPHDSGVVHHVIVFKGFTVSCAVLKCLYPVDGLNVYNMSGRGKTIQLQRGMDGKTVSVRGSEVPGVCMSSNFQGLVSVYGVNEDGKGLLPFDVIYDEWVENAVTPF